MTTLLELKEKLIRFYGKNEIYVKPAIRFVLALFTFLVINNSIGYMKLVSKTPVAVILALVCSMLPVNGLIAIAALVVLADLYALSIEVCLVGLLMFAIIYFIYFRFSPKSGINAVLTPVCFKLHIPYAVPVGSGLLSEAYSVVSVACGTVIYFFIHGVSENASALSDAAEETDSSVSKVVVALNQLIGNKEMYLVLGISGGIFSSPGTPFSLALNQLIGNKEMYLVLGIFIITTLIVYVVRKLDIEHSWTVAWASGILFEAIGLTAGYILLGISDKIAGVIIGSVISGVIAMIIQFLFFNLDYSRTERLQFEDDDYYYYVKAVPKSLVTEKDKQIKRFNGKNEKERLNKKKFAEEMDIDENLLD